MKKRTLSLKSYYRRIKKQLLCSKKEKDGIISLLCSSVNIYLLENPDADLNMIQQHFGSPEQIARTYLNETDTEIVLGNYKQANRLKFIQIAALCVTVCLLVSIFSIANNINTEKAHGYCLNVDKNDPQQNQTILPNYSKLHQSLSLYNNIENNFPDHQYPDYYAGAYIDKSTSSLVILVTNKEAAANDPLLPDEQPGICTYKLSTVSINQMNEAIEVVSDNTALLQAKGVNISYVYDDIQNRRIVIGIQDLSEDKEQAVFSIANYPFLAFENAAAFSRQ